MNARRAAAFFLLLFIGYALIIPGQLATVYLDDALIWVAINLGAPGRWVLNLTAEGFPPAAMMSVWLILLGASLVAAAIALAADPAVPPLAGDDGDGDDGDGGDGVSLRPAGPALILGSLLAATTAYLCLLEPPSNIALLTWTGSVAIGLLGFVRIDRRRGTRLRWPFADGREVGIVLLLVIVSLLAVTHDLTSWRWSGTPDESNFFGVARAMAEGKSERFFLSERGVFEVHPTLSSLYQTLFIAALGSTGFAWRLSSAVALAASLPALYLLAHLLWSRRVAVIAVLLFGTTPVAVGFAHLGYNNTQLYPVVLGSLALAAWARWHRSAAGFYLAGCVAGLGFYTYYPARLTPVLLLGLGLSLQGFSLRGARRVDLAAAAAALSLTLVPVALHPQETLSRMVQFTSLTAGGTEPIPDAASAWQLLTSSTIVELGRQTFMATIYSVYFVGSHHFQWPPVVDPVSGPLTLVGLLLCIGGWRHRNARFLAGAYLLSALLICGTSHYFRPPLTRLLFLSPFAALLAAIALDRLGTGLWRATGSPRFGRTLVVGVTAAAVVWGVVALQYSVRYRYHGYGDGTTAELVRLALQQPDDMAFVYVQRVDTSMWSVDEVLAQYGKDRVQYLRGFDDSARAAFDALQPPFMAVLGLGDETERLAAEEIMMRRFPGATWQDSDPSEHWNLRYFVVREP